jgi:hypothetical protein
MGKASIDHAEERVTDNMDAATNDTPVTSEKSRSAALSCKKAKKQSASLRQIRTAVFFVTNGA